MNGGAVGDFDVVLANPPFAGNVDKADIGESLRGLGTNKTELLFLELILQLLREGGRAAVAQTVDVSAADVNEAAERVLAPWRERRKAG